MGNILVGQSSKLSTPKKFLYHFPKWMITLAKKAQIFWNLLFQRTEMNKFLPACHLRRKNYEFSERFSALQGNTKKFLYRLPKWMITLTKKAQRFRNLLFQSTEMNKFLPACHLRRKNYEFSEMFSALQGNTKIFLYHFPK